MAERHMLDGAFRLLGQGTALWAAYALCVCVIVLWLAVTIVESADAPQVKRVLILHSFGRDFAPFNAASSGFRTELAVQSADPIEFREASLETARFSESGSESPFVGYLRALFADRRPDLVVPFGAPAMNFLLHNRERLFPGVPMLVAAVDERRIRGLNLGPNAAAVGVRLDLPGIVENILGLLPRTANIDVVIGNSPLERFWLTELRQDFQSLTNRVRFTWLNELSFEEMRKQLATLPPNSAVLYAVLLVDAAGVPHEQERALEILHSESNAPIFGAFDSQLGRGIVGGPLYPVKEVSRESARLAVRILSGELPGSIQTVLLGPGTPVYDWRELRRWGISEALLPSGSIVQFRQPTFWGQYKWAIILVLALCILEAVLIDILLRERRRRRLAQKNLEQRLRFEQLVSELSSTFINLPADHVEGQIHRALGQVARLLRFDIAALSVFTGRGMEGRVAFLWRAEGVPEIPSDLTDKDFPWSARELLAGRDVCLRSLEMLPLAARTDRATYENYHVRSSYSVPMVAGGKVIGVLGLNSVWEQREMSLELLQGQRLVGEVFANALARKAAEESLRESEERMSLAANAAGLALWMWDVSHDEVWVTPEGRALFGWTNSEPINFERFIHSLHPDDHEATRDAVRRSLEGGDDYRAEFRVALSDGTTRWFVARGRVELDRNRKPLRMRGIAIDITERKRAEDALKQSENQVRLFVEHTPASVAMFDREMRYILTSRRWLKDYNLGEQSIIGRSHYEVFPEIPERWKEIHRRCLAGSIETCEQDPFPRLDGAVDWVRWEVRPWYIASGEIGGIIMFTEVVTARKRAEEALDKQRAFLRQVIDIDPNFIFAKDREGRFTLVNQAVADAYGTTVENLIGKTDEHFNPNREEVEFFRRMDAEVIGTLQERFIPEERITDAQGKVRWLQTVKRAIVEKDGSANQVLGASTDITRRKETESELQLQREELAHVTRISAMGELAASLAHELNQPLTAILSNAQAAQRFLAAVPADISEVREILKDIVHDNSRAGEVIRRIRALIKKEQIAFAPLDLVNVVGDVSLLLHSDAIVHKVRVSLEVDPELPLVRGDKVQLQQVVLNLLLNAFDAMKDCPAHERQVVVHGESDGMRSVTMTVSDRGIGLSEEHLDKIFQPFYTTKRGGLGMGLSICRSIIEAHGGRLWANNNSDRGATFYFTLPVASPAG